MRRWWIGWLVVATLVALAAVVLAAAATADFVGAGRCRECHPSAYAAWERSAHARAHRALPADHANDPRCTQCHGTGEDSVGSVQCESCHGAGNTYARSYVMKDAELARIVGLIDVKEDTCRRCHTDTTPSIRPYDHARAWKDIEHRSEVRPGAPAP